MIAQLIYARFITKWRKI